MLGDGAPVGLGSFVPAGHFCVLVHVGVADEVGAVGLVWALKYFFDRYGTVLLLWIFFIYSCFTFAFVVLPCLFLATLWSPAGKGLASWLSCV